jgi:hypothetical protein
MSRFKRAGLGGPPTKWSFSSEVTMKSVFSLVMPSFSSRLKNFVERNVVGLKLGDVSRFAGTEGALGADGAVVVGVRK